MRVFAQHKKAKTIIIISALFVLIIMVSLTCIGFFYGNSSEKIWGPVLPSEFLLKTIYKVNNQIYIPVVFDPDTGYIQEQIPYYYGEIAASAREIQMRDLAGPGESVGCVDADFLNRDDTVLHKPVYRVQSTDGSQVPAALLITDSGVYIAQMESFYSDHMKNDWTAYAEELDILFDTQLWEKYGETYHLHLTGIKTSPYYNVDETNQYFNAHLFRKRLSFFFADVKKILK